MTNGTFSLLLMLSALSGGGIPSRTLQVIDDAWSSKEPQAGEPGPAVVASRSDLRGICAMFLDLDSRLAPTDRDPGWSARQPVWRTAVGDAESIAALAMLLGELEAAIRPQALPRTWVAAQSDWRSRLTAAIQPDEVAAACEALARHLTGPGEAAA